MPTIRISAAVAEDTKAKLDRFARASGSTRAHIIEQALLHHLQALAELPPDVIVPTRVVLDAESAIRVRELVARPPEPTEAMKELFDDR